MRQTNMLAKLMVASRIVRVLACVPCLVIMPTASGAEFVDASSRPVSHIGVIGETARPGVYQVGHSKPTLGEVVERAGGMTRRASGSVRIVRGNRLSHMIYIGQDGDGQGRFAELRDGDVLIVDGFASRTAKASDVRGTDVEAEPVPVALVGLKPHPIVIPVPEAYAYPEAILSYLGQNPQMASRLQITSTSPGRIRTVHNSTHLAGPTVISFESFPVQTDSLPKLPAVFTETAAEPNSLHSREINELIPAEPSTTPMLSRIDQKTEPPRLIAPQTLSPQSHDAVPVANGPALPTLTPPQEPTLIRQIREIESAQAAREASNADQNVAEAPVAEPEHNGNSSIVGQQALKQAAATESIPKDSWQIWKWAAGIAGVFLTITVVLVRASQRWNATRTAAKTQVRFDRPHQTVEELLRGPHFAPSAAQNSQPATKTEAQTGTEPKTATPTTQPKSTGPTNAPLPKPKFATPRTAHTTGKKSNGEQASPSSDRSRFDDALANLSDAA
ncbi:polysaccharide biosynthesis/export family protein [Thalassoroseus pseudoceratinae]|uniref:hypothetical protein n=1 Tax=Thalassoroseus pseudoceratinae TaxID=2713176 RepID=UPI001423B83A|nr:hypothetical protein [Thalassoroseus pseudoceratinae]